MSNPGRDSEGLRQPGPVGPPNDDPPVAHGRNPYIWNGVSMYDFRADAKIGEPVAVNLTTDSAVVGSNDDLCGAIAQLEGDDDWRVGTLTGLLPDSPPRIGVETPEGTIYSFVIVRRFWRVAARWEAQDAPT